MYSSSDRTSAGLLVSIRDHFEAASCRNAHIDILDIKEPDRGSLGRADATTINRILSVVSQRPVSIALGELHELNVGDVKRFIAELNGGQIAFAKIGLSRMSRDSRWEKKWREIIHLLPQNMAPVAAAYIDSDSADSPSVERVLEVGADLGCTMALLDTFNKSAGSILDHCPIKRLERLRHKANGLGMGLVLAGSIGVESLAAVREIAPQFVGVRGAVCEQHDRRRGLSAEALTDFSTRLHSLSFVSGDYASDSEQ